MCACACVCLCVCTSNKLYRFSRALESYARERERERERERILSFSDDFEHVYKEEVTLLCISSLDCTRMPISREKIWGKHQQQKKYIRGVQRKGRCCTPHLQQQQHFIYNLHQYGDLPREIWEIRSKILKYIYISGMCRARGVCMQFLSVLNPPHRDFSQKQKTENEL